MESDSRTTSFRASLFEKPHWKSWAIAEAVLAAACIYGADRLTTAVCSCDTPVLGARLYSSTSSAVPIARVGYGASDESPQLQFSIDSAPARGYLVLEVTDLTNAQACQVTNAYLDGPALNIGSQRNVPTGMATVYPDRQLWLLQFTTIPGQRPYVDCNVIDAPSKHTFDSRMISFVLAPPLHLGQGIELHEGSPLRFNLLNSDPANTDVLEGERDDSPGGQITNTYLLDKDHPIFVARWTDSQLTGREAFALFILAAIASLLLADIFTDIKHHALARKSRPHTSITSKE